MALWRPSKPYIWTPNRRLLRGYCGQLVAGGGGGGGGTISPSFFVSPTGSDSNNGTSRSTPFLTMGKAQSAMINQPANGIKATTMMAGTYHVSSTLTITTSDNGTTWQYDSQSGVNTAVIDGGGNTAPVTLSGPINGWTWNGIKVQNVGNTGITRVDTSAVQTANNITIMNSEFANTTGLSSGAASQGAVCMFDTTNTTIKNNYFHNMISCAFTIIAYYSGQKINGAVVSGNVCLNTCTGSTDNGAIYFDCNGSGASAGGATVTNNFVRDYGASNQTDCHAIYFDDNASGITASGNVLGPPTVGSGANSKGPFLIHDGTNNKITGNIVDLGSDGNTWTAVWYDNGGIDMSGSTFTGNCVLSKFTGGLNTSFSGQNGFAFFQNAPSGGNFTISGNNYWNYAGGGSVFSNGTQTSDSSPTNTNPNLSGYLYGNPTSPSGFPPIVGGWGPPGFVIPSSTNHSTP